MKKHLKYIQLILVASSFFYLSCQPDGGDLVPIKLDEGRIVSTQSTSNVAYQYDTDKFSIKVYGKWESLEGNLAFTVIVKNRCKCEVIVDFNKIISSNTLQEQLKVSGVGDPSLPVNNWVIENMIGQIDGSKTRIFQLMVGEEGKNYKKNVKYRGNELTMTIPVTVTESKIVSTTNYDFQFRYESYLPSGEYTEILID
jgi:hypothetical protein